MKDSLFIMFFWLIVVLTGCRAQREVKAQQERQYADEIGVVLRRVDSLSSTFSEKQHLKIEFYPPDYSLATNTTYTKPDESAHSAAPAAALLGPALHSGSAEGGGIGAVKSIEISSETDASTHTNALTDSTAVSKTAEAETLQSEKASEARHDNGTVFIVSVAVAVVLLLALLIIIRKFFNK